MQYNQLITLTVVRKVFAFSAPKLTDEQVALMNRILGNFFDDYPYLYESYDDIYDNFDEKHAYEICAGFMTEVSRRLGITLEQLNVAHEFSMTE